MYKIIYSLQPFLYNIPKETLQFKNIPNIFWGTIISKVARVFLEYGQKECQH